MTSVHPSAEDVLAVAALAVDDQDVVVRDAGLLESAVHRPRPRCPGKAYPDLLDKAAALLQSLVVNRPFADGNKRAARASCVVFLTPNNVRLRPGVDAAERLVIAVAPGAVDEVEAIGEALRELAERAV
ncbi:type II toxin-antitoxin system death-on-curing family toxin [Streptomyces sennicomposti]